MKYRTNAGFTLIELTITVIVIGILSTVAFLGVQNTLISNRDRTRLENVRAITTALEDYYSDNGEYPLGLELNPNSFATELSAANLTNVKTFLPELADSNLTGPQTDKFFSYCRYTSPGPCPADSSANWTTYHSKQYIYVTPYQAATDPQTVSIDTVAYGSTAWGCQITVYYDTDQTNGSDQGFALAYRKEYDGTWVFVKSRRGNVTIANTAAGTHPSSCTFTKL